MKAKSWFLVGADGAIMAACSEAEGNALGLKPPWQLLEVGHSGKLFNIYEGPFPSLKSRPGETK